MRRKRKQRNVHVRPHHNRKNLKWKNLEMFPQNYENTRKKRPWTSGRIRLTSFDDAEILQRAICEIEQVVFREFELGDWYIFSDYFGLYVKIRKEDAHDFFVMRCAILLANPLSVNIFFAILTPPQKNRRLFIYSLFLAKTWYYLYIIKFSAPVTQRTGFCPQQKENFETRRG